MKVFILLGGNLGDVRQYFQKSIEEIEKLSNIAQRSSIVQSKSWGFESSDLFLNQVLEIETEFTASELLEHLHNIEKKLGRIRLSNGTYSSRTIDLDILYYDNFIIHSDNLSIPHPRLHLRKFTLVPLAEIAPNLIHPTLLKTNKNLLEECVDESIVQVLD